MKESIKTIVIPLDGSEAARGSLEYLDSLYGPTHDLMVHLIHIMPALPSVLTDDRAKTIDEDIKMKVRAHDRRTYQGADRILAESKRILCAKGFDEKKIITHYQKKNIGLSYDICEWAKTVNADVIFLTRRGKTISNSFYFGSITNGLVNSCVESPVVIVEKGNCSKSALVFFENAENGLRTAQIASYLLSGTGSQITIVHSIRHLRRFIPSEVLEEVAGTGKVWREKALRYMEPHFKRAKEIFLQAGFFDNQITLKVIEGSENTANDIIKKIRTDDFGMIFLGRHGVPAIREVFMDYSITKLMNKTSGLAIWIV